MSDCSAPEIREAYDEVRSDASDINWLLITYAEGSNNKKWTLIGKGSGGFEELKSNIGPNFLGFGYVRVIAGDDLSKRPKFVFIKYLSAGLKMTIKAQLNLHRGDVEKVLNQANVNIEADSLADLDEESVLGRVKKAGGANYDAQAG
jgi:hypothetical protein